MDALGMRLRGKAAASDRNGCFELYPSVSQLHCHEWATTVGEGINIFIIISSSHNYPCIVGSSSQSSAALLQLNCEEKENR